MAGRRYLDDGGAGALHIGLVVEVADQDVALPQISGAAGYHRHPVRVDVPVARHRRRDRRDMVQRAGEGREAAGAGGSGRQDRAAQQAGRGGDDRGERARGSSCWFHFCAAPLRWKMSLPMGTLPGAAWFGRDGIPAG
jgi:hypothetical protein